MPIYFGNNKVAPSGVDKVYYGSNLVYEKTQPIAYTGLCLTANTPGSTVELVVAYGSPSISNTAYSRDGVNWITFTPSTQGTNVVTLTNVGDKVYFRNNITGNLSSSNCLEFKMSGSISASGNINSMYSATNFENLTTLTYKYCYCFLFSNCTSLTSAPDLPAITLSGHCYYNLFCRCTSLVAPPALPATTLADECYGDMFQECTSLTTAPALSVTTLADACYCHMFYGCTSLTTPPVLPATTLNDTCYYGMFAYCSSLVTPPVLPATTLASQCYWGMFEGCTNLTSAPALPATTLAEQCYKFMFQKCASLTTPPILSATTLAEQCYNGMFIGCTSLTSAPELPATTLAAGCYWGMFEGCTKLVDVPALIATQAVDFPQMFKDCSSLNSLTVAFTSWSGNTYEWVDGVASSGTFICPSELPKEYGVSKIPTGWTVNPRSISTVVSPSGYGTTSGSGTYGEGASCTLTASPNSGYAFSGWYLNGTLVSSDTSYTFTVTSDAEYTAQFREEYVMNITTEVDPSGTGTTTGDGTYREGHRVTLTATASSGYMFNGWYLNGSKVSSRSTYTFTVTSSDTRTYIAKFTSDCVWTITSSTISSSGVAGIIYNGTTYKLRNEVITITLGTSVTFYTPSGRYGTVIIDGVTVKSKTSGLSYTYTPTASAKVIITGSGSTLNPIVFNVWSI